MRRREQGRNVLSAVPSTPYKVPRNCQKHERQVLLTADFYVCEDFWTYRKRIVSFSIRLYETDSLSQTKNIFRIDAARPEPDIHRHRLSPHGDNGGDKLVLEAIPGDGTGQEFVHSRYHDYFNLVLDVSQGEYERWCSEK